MASDLMLAAILYGKEHIQLERIPVPALGPGDILVRVRAALTCGTDVKVFRRGYHARMIVPPAVFGHEFAGDVVATGDAVTRFQIGQRVVAANSAPCLHCFYCQRGKVNLCEDLLFNNGAYAEFIRIPARIVERNTYELAPHLDYRDAALAEPLACVVKGLEDTGLEAGDTVAVIGVGPIGSMFVRLAKLRGAQIIAIGRRRSRLDHALALGADRVIATEETEDPVAAVRELTGGRGADVVIEAVGRPETWNWSVEMLRRGGIVNFFGGPPGGTRVELDTNLLHYSEITCKASFHHTPRAFCEALDIIESGGVAAQSFVQAEEPLESLSKVMFRLMEGSGPLKTAIVP
ncbi:MAG: zinc-binding dehydrogenase [Acidobacteriota bacterium]|nr:zinc-binding dehydrogenase [Acidobacteriota bacterium]